MCSHSACPPSRSSACAAVCTSRIPHGYFWDARSSARGDKSETLNLRINTRPSHSRSISLVGKRSARKNALICPPSGERGSSLFFHLVGYHPPPSLNSPVFRACILKSSQHRPIGKCSTAGVGWEESQFQHWDQERISQRRCETWSHVNICCWGNYRVPQQWVKAPQIWTDLRQSSTALLITTDPSRRNIGPQQ